MSAEGVNMEEKDKVNITIAIGSGDSEIRLVFYLKKTILNEIKMKIFCFLVPIFKIVTWTDR